MGKDSTDIGFKDENLLASVLDGGSACKTASILHGSLSAALSKAAREFENGLSSQVVEGGEMRPKDDWANYHVIEVLGQGSYGTIYKVERVDSRMRQSVTKSKNPTPCSKQQFNGAISLTKGKREKRELLVIKEL